MHNYAIYIVYTEDIEQAICYPIDSELLTVQVPPFSQGKGVQPPS